MILQRRHPFHHHRTGSVASSRLNLPCSVVATALSCLGAGGRGTVAGASLARRTARRRGDIVLCGQLAGTGPG